MSLAICCPKPWLNFFNLHRGDLVEVVSEGSIEIKPLKNKDLGAKRES